MPDQLSHAEKEARVRRAGEVIERMRQAYLAGRVGQVEQVLFETDRSGHGGNYCPVRIRGRAVRGEVKNVLIDAVDGDTLLGEVTKRTE